MLWHKAWIETRWRFLIGLALLLLSATGTVFGFQLIAAQVAPFELPQGEGLLAQAIREAMELSRTFRGYVWLNAFSQNFVQLSVLSAALLGTGGLRAESPGTLYTLALPFSRRALMLTRAASGLLELLALTMLASLAIVLLAPAIGERYSVVSALVHGSCLFAVAAVFFGLTFWLSTVFADPWRPGLLACVAAMAIGLVEAVLSRSLPGGLFHVARAESYFRGDGIPWLGATIALALAAALVHRAIVAVERRDF